jgi:hypothetical protein
LLSAHSGIGIGKTKKRTHTQKKGSE